MKLDDAIEWRFFVAESGSPSAAKLEEAQDNKRAFTKDFLAFEKSCHPNSEVVAFEEDGAWAPQLVEFGLQIKGIKFGSDVVEINYLGPEWMATYQPGVYQADINSEFYRAQASLLRRLNEVSRGGVEWILGAGGNKDNNPALANVMQKSVYSVDEKNGQEIIRYKHFSVMALRLDEAWLFLAPVHPDTGKYYQPPGSEEISSEQLTQRLRGKDIEDLEDFDAIYPIPRQLKTFWHVRRFRNPHNNL